MSLLTIVAGDVITVLVVVSFMNYLKLPSKNQKLEDKINRLESQIKNIESGQLHNENILSKLNEHDIDLDKHIHLQEANVNDIVTKFSKFGDNQNKKNEELDNRLKAVEFYIKELEKSQEIQMKIQKDDAKTQSFLQEHQ